MSDDIPAGFAPITHHAAFGRHNGPFYHKDEDGGFVRAFRVLDRHLNAAGIVHGGMLATFMDIVLAQAVLTGLGRPAFTVRLTTDFLGPARKGEWVEGRARVRRATRTLVFVDGDLETSGRPVMRGSGVFFLRERRG